MLDFLIISTRSKKRGIIEIYPKFIIKKSSDLMIRGGDFYAIWDDDAGLWSTDEQDALRLIDNELDNYANNQGQYLDTEFRVLHMWDAESGMIDSWHKYCQKQMRDNFHMLDEKLIFSNDNTEKKDYASKRLSYPLKEGPIDCYDELVSTLYSVEERQKIEWAIGSIISGDSKNIQKFMVLYGAAGTGKSTILNIIQDLFDGYYSTFDSKALGSSNNSFALEPFKKNPLVAIQHDGDLSRIEDNTRINSLVSHELMTVNEKFKSQYSNRFKSFLFMGTNKPVRISDSKSGIIRRLIDVTPTGNKLSQRKYLKLMSGIKFELGAIAWHCRDVYLNNIHLYDNYIPLSMLAATNDFYNFMLDSYYIFKKNNGASLEESWVRYKAYCENAKVLYPLSRRVFAEEMKTYFIDFKDRFTNEEGKRIRSYYHGFKTEKFKDNIIEYDMSEKKSTSWIIFKDQHSLFDDVESSSPAQYATSDGKPYRKWSDVTTTLADIDTSKLHYVKINKQHIVIDFDLVDEQGNKSLEKNIEAASKFKPTYAELSKSGCGIHLHYIYDGDVTDLSRVYDEKIEIKVFLGKSSLRRKLTKCNDIPIETINSGLPLKGDEKKLINDKVLKTERGLRRLIERNLNKEILPNTKPSIDFITKILDDANNNGLVYDISDMRESVISLALSSTNNKDYCLQKVRDMKFISDAVVSESITDSDGIIIFYDVEVFPNLFIVCWKKDGTAQVIKMINPTADKIAELLNYKLIGFNCRRYDNHILYARLIGYDNEQLYNLSQKIIKHSDPNAGMFREAYNISYTDVYDFASAGNKMSLKKLEIKMGIHHQELGIPWDQPVPEDRWEEVAQYCANDVNATEAAFHYLEADYVARTILADVAGSNVNTSTNSLTTKIILGDDKEAWKKFMYRDLALPTSSLTEEEYEFLSEATPEMVSTTHGEEGSLLPYFPGYKYEYGKSYYRGEEVGEGGYVYAEPGAYTNVVVLDVNSMHPSSAIAEIYFGIEYTKRFKELVDGRVNIKHEVWSKVNVILGGKLKKWIKQIKEGKLKADALADALKTAINSVYGLTSAKFENPFYHPDNKDNIIAKRGALFMIDLKHAVQEKGFVVTHIKTDSIKIPNATPEIIQFVKEFGKKYGYTFDHESTYEKMCLVNDAVYIAKYADEKTCMDLYGYIPTKQKFGKWDATGTQFQVPYVFKTLFSRESIEFDDMCEIKSVTTALYLDMNEDCPDVSDLEKKMNKLEGDYKKGLLSDTTFESECNKIKDDIAKGHSYHFVGRVGQFTPMKEGCGAGILLRENNGKYHSVGGTKGYRWMESEMVRQLGLEEMIDKSYYNKLVDKAVDAISEYCDFEWFISDDKEIIISDNKSVPCGDQKYETCFDCPHFNSDAQLMVCDIGYDISSTIMNKPVGE